MNDHTGTVPTAHSGTVPAAHYRAHLHAFFAEYDAPFDIETGEMLGSNPKFPSDKAALVKAWIILHREDLFANWRRAVL